MVRSKLIANFYASAERVDPEDLSAQEVQSLIDTINSFLPKELEADVDYDTFEVTLLDDSGSKVGAPVDWLQLYINRKLSVKPQQYGLNPWPANMYLEFRLK